MCAEVSKMVAREVSKFVDTYDVTLDVCLSTIDQQALVLNQLVCFIVVLLAILNFVLQFCQFAFISGAARDSEDRCVCGR